MTQKYKSKSNSIEDLTSESLRKTQHKNDKTSGLVGAEQAFRIYHMAEFKANFTKIENGSNDMQMGQNWCH